MRNASLKGAESKKQENRHALVLFKLLQKVSLQLLQRDKPFASGIVFSELISKKMGEQIKGMEQFHDFTKYKPRI